MAFILRDDIAPELYPISWLVGTWHGYGMLGYQGIPERTIVNEVTFDHDGGPYLRSTSTLWLTDPELSGPVDHETTGAGGHLAPVSYTHLRAHETRHDLVCRLLLEKKKKRN